MREKQTYEVTITSKLEALPIPDMADAIWSRIEAQLDIDLPTDDGGGSTPSPDSPIGFGWFGATGLFCVAAIIISLFSISDSNTTTETTTSTQEILQGNRDSLTEIRPPPDRPNPNPKNSGGATLSPDNSRNPVIPIDSNVANNVTLLPQLKDSPQAQLSPIVSVPLLKDTSPPPKRSRGVKGITDADYRIVPKKDST